MHRITLASLAAALTILGVGCASDGKSSPSSVEPTVVPASSSAEDESASPAGATETTGATDTVETVAVETVAVETTGAADTSDVPDTTDFVDLPDVIDTAVEGSELPPLPTGDDVPPELCTALGEVKEYFDLFDQLDEDTASWAEVQAFDEQRTPDVLEALGRIGDMVPELAEQSEMAQSFVIALSEVVRAADSFDAGSAMFDQMVEEDQDELIEGAAALELIVEYSEDVCEL